MSSAPVLLSSVVLGDCIYRFPHLDLPWIRNWKGVEDLGAMLSYFKGKSAVDRPSGGQKLTDAVRNPPLKIWVLAKNMSGDLLSQRHAEGRNCKCRPASNLETRLRRESRAVQSPCTDPFPKGRHPSSAAKRPVRARMNVRIGTLRLGTKYMRRSSARRGGHGPRATRARGVARAHARNCLGAGRSAVSAGIWGARRDGWEREEEVPGRVGGRPGGGTVGWMVGRSVRRSVG